ncbi:ATP-binding domain-containing protein [Actinophytocola sp.]|uniref:ATP-binding domain-containing protein n=1 Tax=Actinophytocola sp. TaxID=1872138 RepID=UPI003D6C530B
MRFDMTEVLAIGPLTAVADKLRRRSRSYRGLVAGTVHTAQGKQADIVILVLGSDPRKPGSRQWASSRSNLLNVAVSRAKRRLYVIGNLNAWSTWPYFSTLARSLPHAPPLS